MNQLPNTYTKTVMKAAFLNLKEHDTSQRVIELT